MRTKTIQTEHREFIVSEITLGDIDSLCHSATYQRYYRIKKDAEKIPELRDMVKDVARECAENPVTIDTFERVVGNADLALELAHKALQHYHKDLPLSEVEALSMDEQLKIIETACDLTDLQSLAKKKRRAEKPSPLPKSTKNVR